MALLVAVLMSAPFAAAAQTAPAVGVAPPAGFEAAFTGALVSTYPDGRKAELWLSGDGTFVGKSRAGGRNSGKWSLNRGRVCMRQTRPIPLPFHYCTPLPASLAASWSAKAPTGEPVTVEFVAGDRP